jgi:hypothetical protein
MAVFSVAGEEDAGLHPNFPHSASFDLIICFNGVPDTVILEIKETTWEGHSGESGNPETQSVKRQKTIMRAPLKASHARAFASALLSAATEVKRR